MEPELISVRESNNNIVKLECYTRLDSTAALARKYAQEGYPDRYAVIAEHSGPEGVRGIYMSMILRPSIFPSQAGLLSALSTVALVTALEEHTTKRLGIGWVSNVFCEGKQIGGVSIEGKLDNFTSYEYIIVNFTVELSDENFPPRISDLIQKVFASDNHSMATIIAKNIISKFFPLYSGLKNSEKFMTLYTSKFILTGVRVKMLKDGKKQACRIVGVDPESCALLLDAGNRTRVTVTSPTAVQIPKTVRVGKK